MLGEQAQPFVSTRPVGTAQSRLDAMSLSRPSGRAAAGIAPLPSDKSLGYYQTVPAGRINRQRFVCNNEPPPPQGSQRPRSVLFREQWLFQKVTRKKLPRGLAWTAGGFRLRRYGTTPCVPGSNRHRSAAGGKKCTGFDGMRLFGPRARTLGHFWCGRKTPLTPSERGVCASTPTLV